MDVIYKLTHDAIIIFAGAIFCSIRAVSKACSLLAILFLVSTFLPLNVNAQDTPDKVRQQAQIALSQGAYADAAVYLHQLIDWFGESKKETTIASMRPVYFNLGLCYFLLGQFSESETAFETFLKKYRTGPNTLEAAVYIADGYRFTGNFKKASKEYSKILKKYEGELGVDWKTDILCSMARCALAEDDWEGALPILKQVYEAAPDPWRANWAATLMTVAYLKKLDLENVYRLVPYLLQPLSFASRSVAFNMAALEAADALFAEERYRDALWVYRLIYSHDMLEVKSGQFLELMQKRSEMLKKMPGMYRELMRVQENIGEIEQEIKSLDSIENYDIELAFRVARSYKEIHRYREGIALFLYLYEETDNVQQAEEALFLAFYCATMIRPWDRAFELGDQYMTQYPAGEFYGRVSLTVGLMHARLQNWPKVISVLTKALEVSPQHESGAECMFLIGYASFMEEKFEDAVTWLRKMNNSYPGNERVEEGTYWMGMSLLFDKKYDEAFEVFKHFLREYPNSIYAQDARFRYAVADYGLSRFRDAEEKLKSFAAAYPKHALTGEAYMMLGDISGFFGELEEAIKRLRIAMDHELNIELYNYCAFRCGEILNELNNFDGLVSHFKAYIEQNREDSNIPLAIYWIGRALWQKGEREGALDYFRATTEKYGGERSDLGIDMILEEWVGRSKSAGKDAGYDAWREMWNLLVKAQELKNRTLALRLERIYFYKPDLSTREKENIINHIVQEENIPYGSAGVLEFIMDEAQKLGKEDLAVKAAEALIKDFTETDYALGARMMLAKNHIKKKEYAPAMLHLNVIREVFATSSEAAEALLFLGNLNLMQRKFEEADKCFKDILGVKEWRGSIWPAALYGRGEAARLQQKYENACAYYERIYLMYSHYTQWSAKAYVQRAKCLSRLYEPNKAREILQEMLSIKELAETPEAEEARKVLAQL